MYGSVLQSTSEPCSTCWGGIPWVMSMISASGAIRFITPWQVPTKSSWSPKSERNVITIGWEPKVSVSPAPTMEAARAVPVRPF